MYIQINDVKEEDFPSLAVNLQTLLIEAGFPYALTYENRFQAVASLSLHSVFLSRKAELDQFVSGLGRITNLISCHTEKAKSLLESGSAKPLTAEDLMSLVEFEDVDDLRKDFFNRYVLTERKFKSLFFYSVSNYYVERSLDISIQNYYVIYFQKVNSLDC